MGCGRRDRNRIFLHCEALVPPWLHPASPTVARRCGPLAGAIRVPGDKSISHRALMLGALAVGRTEITGLLEGEDVLATAAALNALGASVTRGGDGQVDCRRHRRRRPRRARRPARSGQFRNRGAAPPRHAGDAPDHRLRHWRRVAEAAADGPRRRAAEPLRGALRQPRRRSACRSQSAAPSIRSRSSIVCRYPRPRSNPRYCSPGSTRRGPPP